MLPKILTWRVTDLKSVSHIPVHKPIDLFMLFSIFISFYAFHIFDRVLTCLRLKWQLSCRYTLLKRFTPYFVTLSSSDRLTWLYIMINRPTRDFMPTHFFCVDHRSEQPNVTFIVAQSRIYDSLYNLHLTMLLSPNWSTFANVAQ